MWCLQGQIGRTAESPVQVRTLQQTLKLSVVSFGSLYTEDVDNTFSFLFLLIWEEFLRVSNKQSYLPTGLCNEQGW